MAENPPRPDTAADRPSIALPAILWRKRHAMGGISHVVTPARHVDIAEATMAHVSPRVEETLLVLESGERIVVTTRRTCPHPDGVDGVLLQVDGTSSWISHRLLEGQDDPERWKRLKADISASWLGGIRYAAERLDADGNIETPGLRPPQIGALHAIGMHWSLQKIPATVVMPTGTGKTETMIAAMVGEIRGTVLVVLPSTALRSQTQSKFETLGLLRELGVISESIRNPIVGVMARRPRTADDLDILKECHVVIATMAAVSQGTAVPLGPDIASLTNTLIIDEAHHVAAKSWSAFRENFTRQRVLQFTATPFRRDGQLVDGDVIYSYPLRKAQEDGYFKPISFDPVCEIDIDEADRAIAGKAVAQLARDIEQGLDHLLMARCDGIGRATTVHALYEELCPEHRPILVHSDDPTSADRLRQLMSRESRVVVCVDMLGEGFDLPQLKIAAAHDTHKSLAVLLQFTGRFTRTANARIGDATFIANIADQDVSAGLERLYSEDPDWNKLLAELSSEAVREHRELVEFLRQSTALSDEDNDESLIPISPSLLRPKFSAVAYRAAQFHPRRFHRALDEATEVHRAWLHEPSNTLYFVTRTEPAVQWTRAKSIQDRQWDLFVVHHNPELGLLFIHSSDKSSLHEGLAKAVAGQDVVLIKGDSVFRTLASINRLQFQNIGITKHGRRNLRYAMYTGADVKQALDQSHTAGSTKSNLQGTGYEDGMPVAVGCSYKGRVWSKESGSVSQLADWCGHVGAKLVDETIDTNRIIENVMIPEEVDTFPDATVLCIEWPLEILKQQEDRVVLRHADTQVSLSLCQLLPGDIAPDRKLLPFHVEAGDARSVYELRLGVDNAFAVVHIGGPQLSILLGRRETTLDAFLSDYPPLVRFVDLSELDGNLLVRPQHAQELTIAPDRFEVWDWSDVDVTKESLWKDGSERPDSVQALAARRFIDGGFDIVFDDDAPGEAADLVCFKIEDDAIRFALVHCKYSPSAGGARIKDAVEVCAQAVRSGRWLWNVKGLCRHVVARERLLTTGTRPTRFLRGTPRDLNRVLQLSRFRECRGEVVIVQPGISQSGHTPQQAAVLAAAHCFLNDTVGIPLDVICSA